MKSAWEEAPQLKSSCYRQILLQILLIETIIYNVLCGVRDVQMLHAREVWTRIACEAFIIKGYLLMTSISDSTTNTAVDRDIGQRYR